MVRSASCFKVIVCAGDEDDQEKVGGGESKVSSDKQRWSFRRKSSSQRVIIHTVVASTPSGNRNSMDLVNNNSHATKKTPSMLLDKKEDYLSVNVDVIGASENRLEFLVNVDESTVTPIQTAIRRFLAQKELAKLKMLVKLQAAIRGHLVRQHAVGALHCIRAIVKMQYLVRARYGKSSGKSETKEKVQDKCNTIKKVDACSAPKIGTSQCYISLDKLLCNSFARQLLGSTPNPKHLNIKCDSLSPSLAWLWMERWMSFASPAMDGAQLETEPEQKPKENNMPSQEENIEALKNLKTFGSKSAIYVSGMNNLVSQAPCSSSTSHLLEDNKEQLEPVNAATCVDMKASPDIVPEPNQNIQPATIFLAELKPRNSESEMQTKPSDGRVASDLPNMGAKNIVGGSRKQSNPSFVAAQSKFMELTLTGSAVSYTPLHQDAEHDSKSDTHTSKTGTAITNAKVEFRQSDRSSKFIGGSDCGTQLSITSTLDSPDGSYNELSKPRVLEHDGNGKMPDEGACNVIKDGALSFNDTPTFFSKPEKHDSGMTKSEDAKTNGRMVEKKLKRIKSGKQVELKTEKNHRVSCSSGKDSPRNFVTSPGSQATPSSQLIAKSGYTKHIESRKSKDSLSSGKKSSLSSARNSSASASASASDNEQLHQKVHTRRSSLGSATSDLFELERTDSRGSISLPSYMKATVSAKARLFASTSPRLSPDVLEKDMNHTKRHSLPVANVKQISPKLQQLPKRSGTHSQERTWQK
ncbi:hypothetical protein QQ045_030708 [Rhodiola kirilowii]